VSLEDPFCVLCPASSQASEYPFGEIHFELEYPGWRGLLVAGFPLPAIASMQAIERYAKGQTGAVSAFTSMTVQRRFYLVSGGYFDESFNRF
jgi:hypothetical protein